MASCSRSCTRNAAVFVLPSRLEGLALTLLEAASYRLPLVASDIPPNREVIGDDGPGGRLFASGDEAGLTAALTATFGGSRGVRVAGWGAVGDRVVGEYDWDAATAATEDVYEQVLRRVWRRPRPLADPRHAAGPDPVQPPSMPGRQQEERAAELG